MDSKSTASDRRKFARVPYGAWIENEVADEGLRFYLAQNLSAGGLLLKAQDSTPPAVGSRVRLRLVVENEARVMSVQGEVVRHGAEGSGDFAVRFTNLDPARTTFLQDLISELSTS
ncbi:MAG: PilZ domain-containing protein [Deltaproteobacteria bacterium]|nr:PilZ domain-containing protein [Deltaproteobacteria bacterium]